MRKVTEELTTGQPITRTYDDDGTLISESWIGYCYKCGGTNMRKYHLADNTGGGEYCPDCGFDNSW